MGDLLRIDELSFRRPVRPGEELMMEATVLHRRDPAWKYSIKAKVGDNLCADGEILAAFTEKK